MEPVNQPPQPETPPDEVVLKSEPLASTPKYRGLRWVFIGGQGLRAGWSVALFIILTFFFLIMLGSAASLIIKKILYLKTGNFTPATLIITGVIEVLAILGAGVIVARIESRRIVDYNLTGSRRFVHFLGGLAAGFAALSVLVGALAWGGWINFGPAALTGGRIFSFGALWVVAFLLTGFWEEGSFRCYLQFTVTRGINFWWALGIVGGLCLDLMLRSIGYTGILAFFLPMISGNSIWGVYFAAVLGLAPCLWLHLKKAEGSNFWQAAWVTSTLFGFVHTGNGGENWVGIFAAAIIGFVFCVSIRLTGSAWWAIGCHASWDWAESYFYGTADSGMVAQGHYLSTSPAGNVLWSGGTDGPEGSLLVLGVLLLLLLALIVIYGRKRTSTAHTAREVV
jgi:hypothetical protein